MRDAEFGKKIPEFSWYLHVWNGVAVAAYVRLTSRSQATFQNNEIESHSGLRAQPHLRRVPSVIT